MDLPVRSHLTEWLFLPLALSISSLQSAVVFMSYGLDAGVAWDTCDSLT
jgi:hypothetical protein